MTGGGSLELPAGWVIDQLAIDRLRWQLERAPGHVRAVVAPTTPLRSGASYRTQAERLSVQPLDATSESRVASCRGGVLLRPGVGSSWTGTELVVELDGGALLIDHGTHAHDPLEPTELRPATSWGRSPFPWRPVVVLVALDPDQARAQWARTLVNDLVGLDVEARLATPEPVPGHHLTRPCAATSASIDALRPDVVVALDDHALAAVRGWLPEPAGRLLAIDPGASTVELTMSARFRDVPVDGWIGPTTTADALAPVARRLCGPPRRLRHPPAPPGHVAVSPARRRRDRPVAIRRSIILLAEPVDQIGRRRIDGLAEQLRRGGELVDVVRGGPPGDELVDVDLLVVHGLVGVERLLPLVERRAAAGRTTIVDLTRADVDLRTDPDGANLLEVGPGAEQLIAVARAAVSPSRRVVDELHHRGVAALLLPTSHGFAPWPTAPPAVALQSAPPRSVVGWDVGAPGSPIAPEVGDVADALLALLEADADVSIEIAGDPAHVPDRLFNAGRVELVSERQHTVDAWAVQVWTPHPAPVELDGDRWPLFRAGRSGVATVATSALADLVPGIDRELAVAPEAGPEAWLDAVAAVIEADHWQHHHGEMERDRVRTEYGPTVAARQLRLFLDWIPTGAAERARTEHHRVTVGRTPT